VVTEDGDTPGRAYHCRQSWIRHKLKASPSQLRIMHVEGDSMVPTLHDGDEVLVDMTRQFPSPPASSSSTTAWGWSPSAWSTSPTAIRLRCGVTSDNPLFPAYECTADEIRIIGRIRWFAREICGWACRSRQAPETKKRPRDLSPGASLQRLKLASRGGQGCQRVFLLLNNGICESQAWARRHDHTEFREDSDNNRNSRDARPYFLWGRNGPRAATRMEGAECDDSCT
jgi:hypothetical protein